ncbi:hypothetical protein [Flavobacterium sp. HJJ]|uniref:hypothetical protein n=1 Tax=Flavobacterium sp. HJJ TaxID=2783792 RepID=UPI00188B47F7|nr:hypothetical protein [Flavobacterium sp. HJJ]MBF4473813.1 hypothetical protein [Flavobacterium sp. HJJ]
MSALVWQIKFFTPQLSIPIFTFLLFGVSLADSNFSNSAFCLRSVFYVSALISIENESVNSARIGCKLSCNVWLVGDGRG